MKSDRETFSDSSPAPPLVLDVTMFWNPAGGGVRRYLLAKHAWLAREKGWRHALVAPHARGPDCIDCGGLALPRSGGYRLPLARRRAAALIESAHPDLIEAGDPLVLAWAALDAARRLALPTVAFCHGNLMAVARAFLGEHTRLARHAHDLVGRYLARVYRHFDVVLAPSRWMQRELTALGLERVQQQPLGVDGTTFDPLRRDERWRASLGLPDGQRVLAYAGRFAREKHLEVLADAVRRLGPRYTLLAIGHGPAPPGGAQVVRLPFEPRPSRLASMLASVDGFVHAGDQETFGLAALEAMACGTPVALRAAAGLAELADGGTALGVAANRVDAWAEAIEALFDEPGRSERAARARRLAAEHDWRRVLPLLAACYQRLLLGRELHVGEVTTLTPEATR